MTNTEPRIVHSDDWLVVIDNPTVCCASGTGQ